MLIDRLTARDEWRFFGILPEADRTLAYAWWAVLVLRGLLPACFAIAMGRLVAAAELGASLFAPLALIAVVFVLLQVLTPLHLAISANLGSRTAAWLYDQLTIRRFTDGGGFQLTGASAAASRDARAGELEVLEARM
jgi:ATP-binding cassette subfamily B protein